MTTRETVLDPWGPPECLGPVVNSQNEELSPEISADGLSLYFCSNRPGGYGGRDLWVTTRKTMNDPWDSPMNLGPTFNSGDSEQSPSISADGLSLYFRSHPVGGGDIYVAKRDSVLDDWGTPLSLGSTVNHPSAYDHAPDISADGLCLFFSSDRAGGSGNRDIWVTTRDTENDPWREPFNLGPAINSAAHETTPDISADGSTLYFCSDRPGGFGSLDLWEAPILPIVDFNDDGIVDAADMCIMVDYWGTDNQLCDIGPMPWGDGVIDIQDLTVLAEHLFEDYRIIAHWTLDEQMGNIAYDSVGEYDGTLYGEPAWQPDGGIVAGALKFDGIDDYLSTPFVLNPKESPFSVTAWIKGGAPGDVIISQSDTISGRGVLPGCTWLGTDPLDGRLMTGLMDASFGPLESDPIITDGQWHHIGLVYDMDTLHRLLYVDGVMVAEDTTFVAGLVSYGGLYIGASKDIDAGSFFSGLIDDVRIYNQALSVEEIQALAQ